MSVAKKKLRRRLLIGAITLIVVALLAGGYFLWWLPQNQPQPVKVSQQTRDKVEELNLAGDKDLQSRYAELVAGKKEAAAQQLFDVAINQEADESEKLALFQLNITMALQYNLADQALAAALRSVELKASHETYDSVARVYGVKGDFQKQKEYFIKARDAVAGSDAADKDMLLRAYNMRIQNIDSTQEALSQ